MGMGYAAAYADTIQEDALVEIIGNELIDEVKKVLEDEDSSIEELAIDIQYDGNELPEELYEKAATIVDKITLSFKEKTGLGVYLGYHDSSDQGSRYDEVNGYFWAVSGMYELTPAGKKMEEIVQRSFYVTFG